MLLQAWGSPHPPPEKSYVSPAQFCEQLAHPATEQPELHQNDRAAATHTFAHAGVTEVAIDNAVRMMGMAEDDLLGLPLSTREPENKDATLKSPEVQVSKTACTFAPIQLQCHYTGTTHSL